MRNLLANQILIQQYFSGRGWKILVKMKLAFNSGNMPLDYVIHSTMFNHIQPFSNKHAFKEDKV